MKRYQYFIMPSMLALLFVGGFFFTYPARSQDTSNNNSPESPQIVQAPTNTLFNYQGQLLNAGGSPISNIAMPMTFKLYKTLSGGTACWSENKTVNVKNGQFNVLIGQVAAIPGTCLTGNIYLELVVNGETMTPREQLTSAAFAVEAGTLPDQATTRGSLNIAPSADGEGGQINLLQGTSGNNWVIDNRYGTFRLYHDGAVYFSVKPDGTVDLNGHTIENFGGLISNQANTSFSNGAGAFRWIAEDGVHVWIDSNNDADDQSFTINANSGYFGGGYKRLLTVNEDGDLNASGNLSVASQVKFGNEQVLRWDGSSRRLHLLPWGGTGYLFDEVCVGCGQKANLRVNGNFSVTNGTCTVALEEGNLIPTTYDEACDGGQITANSVTTGAVVEANLQTREEAAADIIERFSLGDLLCWSSESERLELCETPNDRLVMAVANSSGKPIVMGAEPVKVIGPVQTGDIIVTSDVPGYAMVNNNPAPGTVIGQALQDFDSESGLIKAMIRKW